MSFKYILDTDICSYILKQKPISVLEKFKQVGTEKICVSVITYSELMFGAEKTKSQKINKEVIDHFVSLISILDWDVQAAIEYGITRTMLETRGLPIGNMDLMIASHAKSKNLILVTNNNKHFSKVEGLIIENWI